MKRVLFVCTGNICRSVMAEYIARRRFHQQFEATSAGTRPGSFADTPNTVFTLSRFDIDASGHRPRDVRKVNLADYDLIVTMNDDVATALKQLFPSLPSDRLTKWRISDPYGDDLAEYNRCANVIHKELKRMLQRVEKQQT